VSGESTTGGVDTLDYVSGARLGIIFVGGIGRHFHSSPAVRDGHVDGLGIPYRSFLLEASLLLYVLSI
jgi:hypothetical protein